MALITVAYNYLSKIYAVSNYIDADKIYASSVLKDRNFSGKVKEISTTDGIKAYFLEEHSIPIVSVSFLFKNSGYAHENEKSLGLTHILADMLLSGAGEYDLLQFKDLCEENGIKIGFDVDADDFSGYLQFPVANQKTGVKLFKSVMNSPLFEEEYLALSKSQLQTILRLRRENPEAILSDKFSETIFNSHPYARAKFGENKTISALKADDLRNFMHKNFAKDNLIIGIVGDIDEENAEILLKDMFGMLPEKSKTVALPKADLQFGGHEYFLPRDNSAQAITQFVTHGTTRQSADFYPLYIANYIFGGSGLNSRISGIIREKEGLTYGIYTYLSIFDAVALLKGSFSATPDNFIRAKELLLSEWQKMAEKGISVAELKAAKDSLLASNNLRFASTGGIADMLVAIQKENLGIDFFEKRNGYIEAVTLEEVNAAAKKYFSIIPDFVIIGAGEKEDKQ